MDPETIARPARPRLNPYTRALRRERIFSRRRLGWPYAEIAREERLSEQRVRQIVIEALGRVWSFRWRAIRQGRGTLGRLASYCSTDKS